MNCSEAKFYENYLTSDFRTNTVISRHICKMASKTVIRSILCRKCLHEVEWRDVIRFGHDQMTSMVGNCSRDLKLCWKTKQVCVNMTKKFADSMANCFSTRTFTRKAISKDNDSLVFREMDSKQGALQVPWIPLYFSKLLWKRLF